MSGAEVVAKIKAAPADSDVWLTAEEGEALNSMFPPAAQPGRIVCGRAWDRNIHVYGKTESRNP